MPPEVPGSFWELVEASGSFMKLRVASGNFWELLAASELFWEVPEASTPLGGEGQHSKNCNISFDLFQNITFNTVGGQGQAKQK